MLMGIDRVDCPCSLGFSFFMGHHYLCTLHCLKEDSSYKRTRARLLEVYTEIHTRTSFHFLQKATFGLVINS